MTKEPPDAYFCWRNLPLVVLLAAVSYEITGQYIIHRLRRFREEVVAVIKSFPAFANTPVIAVTAYAMEGDRQRTLVAGCDGYIQKPIDVDAFPKQVEEFLHGKREHVEEREEGIYLRELNQRLVYRLVNQVEELKRLNQHFVRRATQLADLHRAVQDITSEVGVTPMLEQLLGALSRALGTRSLSVELSEYDVK